MSNRNIEPENARLAHHHHHHHDSVVIACVGESSINIEIPFATRNNNDNNNNNLVKAIPTACISLLYSDRFRPTVYNNTNSCSPSNPSSSAPGSTPPHSRKNSGAVSSPRNRCFLLTCIVLTALICILACVQFVWTFSVHAATRSMSSAIKSVLSETTPHLPRLHR